MYLYEFVVIFVYYVSCLFHSCVQNTLDVRECCRETRSTNQRRRRQTVRKPARQPRNQKYQTSAQGKRSTPEDDLSSQVFCLGVCPTEKSDYFSKAMRQNFGEKSDSLSCSFWRKIGLYLQNCGAKFWRETWACASTVCKVILDEMLCYVCSLHEPIFVLPLFICSSLHLFLSSSVPLPFSSLHLVFFPPPHLLPA